MNKRTPISMYIYRLVFKDGASYVGQHIQYKKNDKYITSSFYAKSHEIESREILLEVNDKQTLDFIETVAIMSDKCNSPKNVNGNLGNYVMCRHLYNIGLSEETKAKIGRAHKGKVVSEDARRHISEAAKNRQRQPCSEYRRQRIKEALNRPECKEKLSKAHKGKDFTEEHKAALSEAAHRMWERRRQAALIANNVAEST